MYLFTDVNITLTFLILEPEALVEMATAPSPRDRSDSVNFTYLKLREHHKKAYDLLSIALEIDESGEGNTFNFSLFTCMCLVCTMCIAVFSYVLVMFCM